MFEKRYPGYTLLEDRVERSGAGRLYLCDHAAHGQHALICARRFNKKRTPPKRGNFT